MKTEVLEVRSERILLIDYSECKSEADMIQVVDQAAAQIEDPSINYTLSDVTGVKFSPGYTDHVKELVKDVFYPNTKRNAIVGITGAQGMILSGLNLFSRSRRKMLSFANREEAIQYLLAD